MTMVKFQVSSVLICNIHTSLKLQLIKYLCTYQCHACGGGGGERQGMGWGFDCLGWPWGRAFDWSCSPRGGDIWIFQHIWQPTQTKKTETEHTVCFPLPCFTHVPYSLERSGSLWGLREPAKAEWISPFCLQILFVLACFWSIEPLKILWYQSKRT